MRAYLRESARRRQLCGGRGVACTATGTGFSQINVQMVTYRVREGKRMHTLVCVRLLRCAASDTVPGRSRGTWIGAGGDVRVGRPGVTGKRERRSDGEGRGSVKERDRRHARAIASAMNALGSAGYLRAHARAALSVIEYADCLERAHNTCVYSALHTRHPVDMCREFVLQESNCLRGRTWELRAGYLSARRKTRAHRVAGWMFATNVLSLAPRQTSGGKSKDRWEQKKVPSQLGRAGMRQREQNGRALREGWKARGGRTKNKRYHALIESFWSGEHGGLGTDGAFSPERLIQEIRYKIERVATDTFQGLRKLLVAALHLSPKKKDGRTERVDKLGGGGSKAKLTRRSSGARGKHPSRITGPIAEEGMIFQKTGATTSWW
ncbi:hypothetical protein DFH09DRAFT_1102209 [Mycena vulgaris]|nr:hypothetical protein DFH09DRAFT_1102209 [Mycena vulgaris]